MVKETKLYDVLEIEYNASEDDVRKGFQRIAKKYNPDTNPQGNEQMKNISFAYLTLQDPTKRRVYDLFGEKGLEDLENGTLDFEALDYGEEDRMDEKGVRQIKHTLRVTLEDLYCGSLKIVNVKTQVECDECNGRYYTCQKCNGSNKLDKLNPVNVQIPFGAPDRHTLSYDLEYPNSAPVRLTVHLRKEQHSTFIRRGNDLTTKITIELAEALTHMDKIVKALDGRLLHIRTLKSDSRTIHNGKQMVLKGEGMPHFRNPSEKGDMFIDFGIEMPVTLTEDQTVVLTRCLQRPEPLIRPPGTEELMLETPTDAEIQMVTQA